MYLCSGDVSRYDAHVSVCLLLYSVSKLPSPLSSALQTHRWQVMVVAFPFGYLLMFEVAMLI